MHKANSALVLCYDFYNVDCGIVAICKVDIAEELVAEILADAIFLVQVASLPDIRNADGNEAYLRAIIDTYLVLEKRGLVSLHRRDKVHVEYNQLSYRQLDKPFLKYGLTNWMTGEGSLQDEDGIPVTITDETYYTKTTLETEADRLMACIPKASGGIHVSQVEVRHKDVLFKTTLSWKNTSNWWSDIQKALALRCLCVGGNMTQEGSVDLFVRKFLDLLATINNTLQTDVEGNVKVVWLSEEEVKSYEQITQVG